MFTTWPEGSASKGPSPLVIGVMGTDRVGDFLKTLEGERVHGRMVTVAKFSGVEEIKRAHVLFISASEQYRLKEILGVLEGSPVLTVSDMEGFAEQGGTIGFLTIQNRLRFAINVASAKASGIAISSRLLNLATNLQK